MDISNPGADILGHKEAAILRILNGVTAGMSGRKIAAQAQINPASTSRVLARLRKAGLLITEQAGGAIFYTANRQHLLWPGVELVLAGRLAFMDHLRATISAIVPVQSTSFIFGSVARRESGPESDIDLCIILTTGTPSSIRESIFDDLSVDVEQVTGNPVQLFVIDDDELANMIRSRAPLLKSWQNEALHLTGMGLLARVRKVSELWAA